MRINLLDDIDDEEEVEHDNDDDDEVSETADTGSNGFITGRGNRRHRLMSNAALSTQHSSVLHKIAQTCTLHCKMCTRLTRLNNKRKQKRQEKDSVRAETTEIGASCLKRELLAPEATEQRHRWHIRWHWAKSK